MHCEHNWEYNDIEIIREQRVLYNPYVIPFTNHRAGDVNHTQAAVLTSWTDFGSKPGFSDQRFRDICCTL